jgi:uroporphyrinogen decarboxylase
MGDSTLTVSFGSREDVRNEVRERIRAFGPGGGFIFNAVHNIQSLVPVENVVEMYKTAREYGRYPLSF